MTTTSDHASPFENEDAVDGLDLTPRHAPPVGGGDTDRGRRMAVVAVLAVLAVAVVFVAYQGLSNASVFFRNADEAVAQRDQLGDKRFRLQGTVVEGTVVAEAGTVHFTVTYNGVDVPVVHRGDPPELFQENIPVVLEGHWSTTADEFDSDRILVKHSEKYEADNPDRTKRFVGDGSVEP